MAIKSIVYLKKTGEKFNVIRSLSNAKKDKYAIEDMNGVIFTDISSKEFKKPRKDFA